MRLINIISSFCLLGVTPAVAALSVQLSFDSETLTDGVTGSYSLVGTFDVSFGGTTVLTLPDGGKSEATLPEFDLQLVSTSLNGTAELDGSDFPLNSLALFFSRDSMLYGDDLTFFGFLYGDNEHGLTGDSVEVNLSGTFTVDGLYGTAPDLSVLFGNYSGSNGNIDVSAVPEPSTYAALLGAAFLGFALLRRRR